MPISHWPADDRPREKLLSKGEDNLSDAELIALLLETGTNGASALDVARNLLNKFGNLRKLVTAPKHQLLSYTGIGPAKYARLKAALEFARRYPNANIKPGMLLNTSELTQTFLSQHLRDHDHEIFGCIFLTTQLNLIAYEALFHGTINETSVYPREIVKRGLNHNAAKIILAHNHPSGDPAPSLADMEITKIIRETLALVDIQVVDHVIIGGLCNYSFAENGLAMV